MKGPRGPGHSPLTTMDAEPPRLVLESSAECADRDRSETVIRQALEAVRAPAPAWVVAIRITSGAPTGVSAEGEISDGSGASRARRVMTGDAADCTALGKAMSEWAIDSLRAQQPEEGPLSPAPPVPAASPPAAPLAPAVRPLVGTPLPIDRSAALVSSLPNALPPEEASVDYDMPTLEIGTGAFLMVGGAAGGYAGVSPFLIDEIGDGVFLRPSVAVGSAVSSSLSSTWTAARLDTCTRLPGRYASRNGIQLDLCGGPDIGFSYVSSGNQPGAPREGKTLPYVALGPSVDLRAEVANLAVSLRAVAGFDVARTGFVDVTGRSVDEAAWSWRFELDFSGSVGHAHR